MTQDRIWSFQDPASSRRANDKLARVVDSGVYSGFFPKVSAQTNRIDLVRGDDPLSTLVTAEGVKVVETDDLSGIVQFINPSTSGLERFDLVVCEYQFTSDRSIQAVFKVVQGTFAATGQTPTLPKIQNVYQVPICYVHINSIVPSGVGPALVILAQDDLRPIVRGQDVATPSEMGALKPMNDPTAPGNDKLYVFPGQFPSIDRTTIIDFRGGYSLGASEVPAIPVGQRRFWVIGVSDAGDVVATEELTSFESQPTDTESAVPVAVVEFFNPGATVIARFRDVRQFITRLGAANTEDDLWADMLRMTYMDEMVYEPFFDLDTVELATLQVRRTDGSVVAATGFTLRLDQAQTALVVAYDGTALDPNFEALEFVMGDWIAGNSLAPVTEFTMLAVHDAAELDYEYSYTGTTTGFSTQKYDLTSNQNAPVISTVGNPPGSLYTRLRLPLNNWTGGAVEYRISSIGALYNINRALAARNVILNDQRTTTENSLRNMIANPFEFWSYPNESAFPADPDQNTDFDLIVSGVLEDIQAGEKQVGPDGWQAQWADGGTYQQGTIRRVPVSASAFRYNMRLFTSDRGTDVLPLEFRVPAHRFRQQDPVSFGVDVDANARGACFLSIRFYKRVAGALTLSHESFSVLAEAGSQRLVVTTATLGVNLDADVVFVGLVIHHQQFSSQDSEVVCANPMAVMGDFPVVLPFSPPISGADEMSHYVSVHRMQQRGYTGEASDVGMMVPMPVKYRELGELRATRVTLSGEQSSANVTNLVTGVSDKGHDLSVLGQTVNAGTYRIDSRVVADVLYEKVV